MNGSVDLYERKTACRLKVAQDNQDNIRKRIRSFYVDERVLNGGYDEIDIMGKDPRRVSAVNKIFDYITSVKEEA